MNMHYDDAETAAREILARYRVGVWTIEIEDGREPRMYADATMMDLLGVVGKTLTPEELYHAWYDRVDPQHYDAVAAGVDRMIKGQVAEIQYPWIHPTRGVTHVRCGAKRDFDCKEYIRLEGTHQDVTDLYHVQKDELEEAKRISAQLEQALEEARRAEKTESMFLATMSHEIRTPLNAVVGFAEFLRQPGYSDVERDAYVQGIINSSNALLSLINDILDLSKIQAGMMPFRGGSCDIQRLFGEMETIFRYESDRKRIELKHSVADDVPVVALREERLRQILINLIGNAIKFTNIGEVEYSATATPEEDGHVLLEIEVRDTGVGIPEDNVTAIFDPFRQTGAVRGGRVYQGTGLGLSICKRLLESVGGTIEVTSRPGDGSRFVARIPHVVRVERTEEAAPVVAEFELPENASVLIVDDVKMNLRIAEKHLELLGVPRDRIRSFENAREALRSAARATPTLVLTDMWMPDMDGEMFARALRADPRLREIPIVAETADADSPNTFDVSMFDDILTKPLTGDKLKVTLAKLFPKKST